MPGVDFEVLRQRISMADVLRLLQFQACSRRGDQLRGPCPVHGFVKSAESFVFGESETGPLPLFPVRFARQRVGAVVGSSWNECVGLRDRVVPVAGAGGSLDSSLVARGET